MSAVLFLCAQRRGKRVGLSARHRIKQVYRTRAVPNLIDIHTLLSKQDPLRYSLMDTLEAASADGTGYYGALLARLEEDVLEPEHQRVARCHVTWV